LEPATISRLAPVSKVVGLYSPNTLPWRRLLDGSAVRSPTGATWIEPAKPTGHCLGPTSTFTLEESPLRVINLSL